MKEKLIKITNLVILLDPLLREKMWNYIKEMTVRNSTAIIITTHYIEEARKADCVGIMRDGKLLAENNPEVILRTLETDSLEDAFLKLCLKEEKINQHNNFAYDNPLFEHIDSHTIPDTGPDKMNGLNDTNHLESSQKSKFRQFNGHAENMLHRNTTLTKKPSRKKQLRALLTKNVLAIVRQPS